MPNQFMTQAELDEEIKAAMRATYMAASEHGEAPNALIVYDDAGDGFLVTGPVEES